MKRTFTDWLKIEPTIIPYDENNPKSKIFKPKGCTMEACFINRKDLSVIFTVFLN